MSDSNKNNNLQRPKKFGFGIISTAKIARKTIDAIFKSKDATVVCIGSRDKKQAEDYAKELKIVDNSNDDQKLVEQIKCYGSYEEVLDDPKVNAVYIPLPSTMKREWAMKAIAKGKHILVEKPFVNARDVEDMIEACHKNNLMFMDGTMWVHHERTHEIYRNFIEKSSITKNNDASSSQLGEIQRVHTVLSRNFMDDKDTNIRFKHDKEPNGCMGDLGWYCIRGILWAFNWDMPVRVLSSSTFYNKNTIDSTGILWFSHGRVATFSCSFKNAGRQVFDLQGSKASLTIRDGIFFPFWNEPFEYPENANAKDHEKADKKTKVDVELQTRYYLVDENGNEKEHLVGACVQVNEMINDFVDGASKLKEASQSSGGKFSIWEDQTIKTQRVLDALVQSSEQHSTISIA